MTHQTSLFDTPQEKEAKFYNTIQLTPDQLKIERQKASAQKEQIRKLFIKHGNLWKGKILQLLGNKMDESSCGRAITDLKNDGFIFKTKTLMPGGKGKSHHIYSTVNPLTDK